MRQFQEKRRFWRWLYSPLSIILLVIIVVFLARAAWDIYQKSRLGDEAYQAALLKLKELEERKKALEEELARVGSQQGLEAQIRQNLPVAKPGEEVIIIVDENE